MSNSRISSMFGKFGYGFIRMVSERRLRKIANQATPDYSDADEVIENITEDGIRTVTFNGDCKPIHYVKLNKKCSIGVFYDKDTGETDIVPNTLYMSGRHKPIDLKKRGGLFSNSDLVDALGSKKEAAETLQEYKNLKLVSFSNPKKDESGYKPEEKAAAMVGGRSTGRTILTKVPNAMFNAAVFFLVSPLLYFVFGPRKSHAKTDAYRNKMASIQADYLTHQDEKDTVTCQKHKEELEQLNPLQEEREKFEKEKEDFRKQKEAFDKMTESPKNSVEAKSAQSTLTDEQQKVPVHS